MRKTRINARWDPLFCHSGPIEVIPNLFCGNLKESVQMVSPPLLVDVLVPLDSLDGRIWDLGYRGEILYFPIVDYGTLPDDVLEELVSKILDRLGRRKKVGLFCLGGHGRTGYVASVVLGKLGYKDPIGYLRKNYCKRAVESDTQIIHAARILGRPELIDQYVIQDMYSGFNHEFLFDFEPFAEDEGDHVCGNCIQYQEGICWKQEAFISESQDACDAFFKRQDL